MVCCGVSVTVRNRYETAVVVLRGSSSSSVM